MKFLSALTEKTIRDFIKILSQYDTVKPVGWRNG